MGISVSMNCPNCGGNLSFEEGAKFTSCQYCNAVLSIEGDDGIHRITFKNKVSRDQAIGSVKGWWRHGFKARDLKRRGEIVECYPIYVPFWHLQARAAGWICGIDIVHSKNGTQHIPRERMVTRDLDWTQVACDAGDIGIEHLRNLNGEAVLHDEGSIPTFEATTSQSDALDQGMQQVTRQARATAHVDRVTFEKVHVMARGLTLIYYPIWMVRYKYSERMYFATVDGITDRVISGRAPGDNLWRSLAMSIGMAVGGAGIGFSAWMGTMISTKNSCGAALFMMAVCLVVAGAAFMFFRYGSEVVSGDIHGTSNIFDNSKNTELIKKMAPDLYMRMR